MEVTKFIKLAALKILQLPSIMQLTWKAIPCRIIPSPRVKIYEIDAPWGVKSWKGTLPNVEEWRVGVWLTKIRSAEGLLNTNKKLQAAKFQISILMTHIFLQKSSVFPLISGLQAARVLFAATQRTCCTTPAAGTDLKIKPKVHQHSSASTAERLPFWDISGWTQPLQSNTGTLQRLVSSLTSRICFRNSFPFSFSSE